MGAQDDDTQAAAQSRRLRELRYMQERAGCNSSTSPAQPFRRLQESLDLEPPGFDCKEGEITGAIAYRTWIAAQWNAVPSSAAFVAFHNLVTISIDMEYLQGTEQRLYCLDQVVSAIPEMYTNDLAPFPPQESAPAVPGLGPQASIAQCP